MARGFCCKDSEGVTCLPNKMYKRKRTPGWAKMDVTYFIYHPRDALVKAPGHFVYILNHQSG